MNSPLTYASLFSAAGLGCHGFKLEGYTCVATAELLSKRLEVQKANDTCDDPSAYYLGDLSNDEYLSQIASDVKSRTSDLTFVLATPPCQGMSVANHKKGNELARNSLVVKSLSFIQKTKPRFFVLENVRSFLSAKCSDTDGSLKPISEAINFHLGGSYSILKRVVNLKNFGSPSSRTRTIVIGVRNDQYDISPNQLFPDEKQAPSLSSLIGNLPSLTNMGEIYSDDIYHSFRTYDERMRPWITNLKPGQSAFDNVDPALRPHRIIAGQRVENKNGNGDKYKRNLWEKVAPCVHTRNDILASQSTIHPIDDRVFSIRELSRMMGVPDTFRWVNFDLQELNDLPPKQKQSFIKEHDMNIRQCLGEGVPTPVFQNIAAKGKSLQFENVRPESQQIISDFEKANPRKKELSAYYTRQDIAFSLLSLIEVPKKKNLKILEPSVGAGAFIPQILNRFQDHKVELDIIDLDSSALKAAQQVFDLEVGNRHATIQSFNHDFLKVETAKKYDLIVGNPPFGSSGKVETDLRIKDLYAKFVLRSLQIADKVAFVIPKSFLGGREFRALRDHVVENYRLIAIEDYGETAFKEIKIETIGIIIGHQTKQEDKVTVRSRLFNSYECQDLTRIANPEYPSWLLYRDKFFDAVSEQLDLGVFDVYRDRALTKSKMSDSGQIPVLKAKDIRNNFDQKYAAFCLDTDIPRSFHAVTEGKSCLVVPNLSYYPRACELPQGSYVDGSAAVLIPKQHVDSQKTIEFFSTKEFFYFYRVARNFSVRSLNVDSISVFYWGTPRKEFSSILSSSFPGPGPKTLFLQIPEHDIHYGQLYDSNHPRP